MKTIAIISFKGGTAKTSTSLHVGAALSQFHKSKVLLIDFDAQANLTAGLGFDPDEHDSLAPVLQGTCNIRDVIRKTENPKLDVIPADTWLERVEVTGALAADRYSHERLKSILENLDYDYIIIDTPPLGIIAAYLAIEKNIDYTLIIVRNDFSKKASVKRIDKLITDYNLQAGILYNGAKVEYSYGAIIAICLRLQVIKPTLSH